MRGNVEDDYLMVSGIQHFQFCKRQWALIHIEQQWEDNVKTVEGHYIHKKVDQPFVKEKRKEKLIIRALPIFSHELRVTGVCDVVEFIEDGNGIQIQGSELKYLPIPIEYKRGNPKSNDCDILQLVTQAMCLEEMLMCSVSIGYLYYNEIKHRVKVVIDDSLKNKVREVLNEMHHYYSKRYTPKVKPGSFCKACSLENICLPVLMKKRNVSTYIEGVLADEKAP